MKCRNVRGNISKPVILEIVLKTVIQHRWRKMHFSPWRYVYSRDQSVTSGRDNIAILLLTFHILPSFEWSEPLQYFHLLSFCERFRFTNFTFEDSFKTRTCPAMFQIYLYLYVYVYVYLYIRAYIKATAFSHDSGGFLSVASQKVCCTFRHGRCRREKKHFSTRREIAFAAQREVIFLGAEIPWKRNDFADTGGRSAIVSFELTLSFFVPTHRHSFFHYFICSFVIQIYFTPRLLLLVLRPRLLRSVLRATTFHHLYLHQFSSFRSVRQTGRIVSISIFACVFRLDTSTGRWVAISRRVWSWNGSTLVEHRWINMVSRIVLVNLGTLTLLLH